jgi:hypothetical protein
MAIVYQHRRNDTNEVFYIGIGNNKHRAYHKTNRNQHWRNIAFKYGYSVDILISGCSYQDACQVEYGMIQSYGRIDLGTGCLVNMKDGGFNVSGWHHNEKTKIKISESQKGRTGHWLGKKHKKESIIKMQKPKKDGFNIGRKVTWNTRPDTKKVIQKSLNGDIIKIWDSASKIKNELNIMVYDALEKRNKTAGGFCWDWA